MDVQTWIIIGLVAGIFYLIGKGRGKKKTKVNKEYVPTVNLGVGQKTITEELIDTTGPSRSELIDVEETEEFQRALNEIDMGRKLVFITGKAGTGKTTFIKYLREMYTGNMAVVAPTGVAALNAKGQTVHSFFRLAPKPVDLEKIKRLRVTKLYERLDLLVVDEVSMVRADMLDGMEKFMRLNGKFEGEFFGGVQVVFVGDLFQLAPVVKGREEGAFIESNFETPYFYSAKCLARKDMACVELRKVFRQDDDEFIRWLNCVREGIELEQALELFNTRLNGEGEVKGQVHLTCTNAVAADINGRKLEELEGQAYVSWGRIAGKFLNVEKKLEKLGIGSKVLEGNYRGKFDYINGQLPAPYDLRLKVGAQVMFTKNNIQQGLVNGTMGVVKGFNADEDTKTILVEVKNDNGAFQVHVQRDKWKSFKHTYNEVTKKIETEEIGSYEQFPLMPAWAITIHKSQGKTLDSIMLDLGDGAFVAGQVYVALSRCRNLEDISLAKEIKTEDVKVDARVQVFYAGIRDGAAIGEQGEAGAEAEPGQ